VYPVFNTLFDEDEALDLGGLERELNWLAEQGVDGIVMGMVSEILRLSPSERIDVARVACSVARAHDLDSVISVGAESTFLAVQLARSAEEVGASALMAIPPITVDLAEPEISAYFSEILDATSIPLVVQDASGYVGRTFSIDLQAALLECYGDRVLFKPEAAPIGPRLTALRDASSGRARVFEGTGGIALIDSYRRGIVGTMPGTDLSWALVALWRMLESGDFAGAYEIAGPLVSLINIQSSLDSFVVVQKHLLLRQGVIDRTISRRPLSMTLDPETLAEVDRLFDQLSERHARLARRAKGGLS
jgi:4-hydroxy-tetrahydrodipicolinate synthase